MELLTPEKVLGYLFFILMLFTYGRIIIVKHVDLWSAIKGEDGRLDVLEIGKLIWCLSFPVLFLSEIFLNLQAGEKIWYSIDAIFGVLILGQLGKQYLDNKKASPDEKP